MTRLGVAGLFASVVVILALGMREQRAVDAGAITTTSPELVRVLGRGGLRYVRIAPAEFSMGCVPSDAACDAYERPRHRVRLSRPYWIGTTEVTIAAFRQFTRTSGYKTWAEREGKGRAYVVARRRWEWVPGLTWHRPLAADQDADPEWPAVQVDPKDAEAFCAWAGGRLPTEAEWEHAARAGRDGEIFPWGNSPTPRTDAVLHANAPDQRLKLAIAEWETFEGYDDGFAMLAPVARFAPNGFGLHDMAGNAYEWTADHFDSTAYARGDSVDPVVVAGDSRVVRGGAWDYYPRHLRSSFRGFFPNAGFPTATVGFRCVRDHIL